MPNVPPLVHRVIIYDESQYYRASSAVATMPMAEKHNGPLNDMTQDSRKNRNNASFTIYNFYRKGPINFTTAAK